MISYILRIICFRIYLRLCKYKQTCIMYHVKLLFTQPLYMLDYHGMFMTGQWTFCQCEIQEDMIPHRCFKKCFDSRAFEPSCLRIKLRDNIFAWAQGQYHSRDQTRLWNFEEGGISFYYMNSIGFQTIYKYQRNKKAEAQPRPF